MNSQLKAAIIQAILTAVFVLLALFIYQKVTTGSFTNAPKKTFEVQGQGTVEIVPKTVQSQFSIQETGTTRDEAQQKGNAKQDKAIKVLTDLGFDKKDIKTLNYDISPNYEPRVMIYPPQPQSNTQNGFVMNISTSFKTDDLQKMNKAIDQLTAVGVNVAGISYDSSPTDMNKYKDEARAKAVEDAHEKAQSMADAAHFKLGSLVTIKDLDNASPIVYPMMKGEGVATPGNLSAPTNIQPGTNEVTASVSITYYIND